MSLGARRPLNAKEIAERVIGAGWTTTGKTPYATLYSAMLREVKGEGDQSRFRQAVWGRFEAEQIDTHEAWGPRNPNC